MEVKHIKKEMREKFLKDFEKSPTRWLKKQQTENFCFDEETQLMLISEDVYNLKFIKNPSKIVCLAAVKQNGLVIRYIKNPTEEMCLEAVKENDYAIRYIENPSEKICLEALKQNCKVIEFIPKADQNFDIVAEFFNFKFQDKKNYYKYLAEKFITKEQAMIMLEDGYENINFVSKKIKKEILELKPELNKYTEIEDDQDFFE